MPSQVITANRLSDGRVVWWTGPGAWTTGIAGARVLADKAEREAALAAAAADVATQAVLDVYAVDVEAAAGGPVPKSLRERIRAEGPTVPSDFPDQYRAVRSA